MKKVFVLICIAFLSFIFTSCTYEPYVYEGDYPELYSVVLNTIPDTSGYILSEIYEAPRIELIESDVYNRDLFLYYEGNNISTYSLVIVQFSDTNEVCYYPELNFISSESNDFKENDITTFKTYNDWNLDIKNDKCNCVPVSTEKPDSPLTYNQIKPFYEAVLPGDEHFSDDRWIKYFISDDYGRSIFTVEARLVSKWAIMMFNLDGTYDSENGYIILTDFYNYQDELKDFKESNNWNEPL